MGRGIALDAKLRFPDLPKEFADRLKEYGNVVFTFWDYHIITFPVKHHWKEMANLELIEKSAKALKEIFRYNLSNIQTPIYMPRVGCGNGRQDWLKVKPILEKYLDDRFIVVNL